ncbi:MAG: Piwi-like protein 2 [Paramarteilia canceri]
MFAGYTAIVNSLQSGTYLSLDTCNKLIRTDTVYGYLKELMHKNHDVSKIKEIISKELVGKVIITKYNNKTYPIIDVDWNSSPKSTFLLEDSTEISFLEYYKSNYPSIKITDLDQPMLLAKTRTNNVYLVPELSYSTGVPESMLNNFTFMKHIAEQQRSDPNSKKNDYQKFAQLINSNTKTRQILEYWGLELQNSMTDCSAHQLENISVKLGNNKTVPLHKPDFNQKVISEFPIKPIDLKHWAIVYTKHTASKVDFFLKSVQQIKNNFNMRISCPQKIIVTDNVNDKKKAITSLSKSNSEMQIIVTVLDFQREDHYNAIKKTCYCELPVPSQVILSKSLNINHQKTKSIIAKILLQMLCKIGGKIWSIYEPLPGDNDKTMICGIDVYHKRSAQSVIALISSLDSNFTEWYSKSASHFSGQEISSRLEQLFYSSLKKFKSHNGTYPTKMIIYRDGVGDGRFEFLKKTEIPQMNTAFEKLAIKPRVTYVVVSKRINTRIFTKNNFKGALHSSKGLQSAPSGTVLDSGLVKSNYPNFYLISSMPTQSISCPTHYILLEQGGYDLSIIQQLTYKLTFLYYNWPGSIKVPAPCQYAHKLAYMVGENLHKAPHEKLDDMLFYL